jgi:hypothetical protein
VRLGWLLLLALAMSGCTITARDRQLDQGPSNLCSADADCSNGNCIDGVCQTLNGQLESLLIEVTPTSDSRLPHIPLYLSLDEVPTSGGVRDLELVQAAKLTGQLGPPPGSSCVPTFYSNDRKSTLVPSTDGKSIPAVVTLTRRDALLGLPARSYIVDATHVTLDQDERSEFLFDTQVPAGEYDVYVAPPVEQEEDCPVPPQLYRRNPIVPDTALLVQGAIAGQLPMVVHFPEASGSLDGWLVDLIEPLSGLPISTQRTLAQGVSVPTPSGKALEYRFELSYSEVHYPEGQAADVAEATDLLRLRPPAGTVAPTVFFDRSGLGLFAPDAPGTGVLLDGFTQFPPAVVVEGQMARLDDGKPVSGHVTLVSKELFGVDHGIFASYQTDVAVSESGVFSVPLPPGKYRVHAVPDAVIDPSAPGLSALEAEWNVPTDVGFQAGKLLELPSLTQLKGQTVLRGAEVLAVASPRSIMPFEQVFGAANFVPRAKPALVDQSGRFVIQVDPGRFDISVRPPEASGFAWFVRPSFEVMPDAAVQDLGRLVQPTPSVVTGTATVSGMVVPSALIRAYAYLDASFASTRDRSEAVSVIQVAETRCDEKGAFTLLVPDRVATPH